MQHSSNESATICRAATSCRLPAFWTGARNGDPAALARLKGVVDELVIQTYQGCSTIWGYERYFDRMHGFPILFNVGLIENGRWIEPDGLRAEPNFRGYVVFLVNTPN